MQDTKVDIEIVYTLSDIPLLWGHLPFRLQISPINFRLHTVPWYWFWLCSIPLVSGDIQDLNWEI